MQQAVLPDICPAEHTEYGFCSRLSGRKLLFDKKIPLYRVIQLGGKKQRIWGIVPQSPMRMIFQIAHFCKVVFTDNALTIRLPFCIKRNCLNWQYFTNLTYVCENALTTEGDNVIMLS